MKKLLRILLGNWINKQSVFLCNPFSGIAIKNFSNVRSVLITKHNRLYYRIKEDTIEIVNMYDTRMNPKKNPYRLK